MMNRFRLVLPYGLAGVLLLTAGWAIGQERRATEKTVVHAVAFTPADGVTPQDFEALKTATATLPQSIPGLRRAWIGKLRQPLAVGDVKRTHGLIFEFSDLPSREAYTSHPARVEWAKIWEKVRASGTVFDVVGE
jgi:hypothetical protein